MIPRLALCIPALALAGFSCERAPVGPEPTGDRIIWHQPGHGWSIQPSFDSSSVYFGSFEHELVAVDRRIGRFLWRQNTGVAGRSTSGYNTVIAGETVAMGDVDIFAYDRRSGTPLWMFRAADSDETGTNTLVTDGMHIFAASLFGRVYAIDARTGQLRWVTNLSLDSTTSTFELTLKDGVIFAGIKRFHDFKKNPTGGVAALDAITGAILWQREFTPENPGQASGSLGSAATYSDLVVVPSEDGRLFALTRSGGDLRWTAPRVHTLPPAGGYNDTRKLAIAGKTLVASSLTGIIVGLDPSTGRELWRNHADRSSPIRNLMTDDSTVYVPYSGEIAALDARTGALLWRHGRTRFEGEYMSTAAVDGDRVYVAGKNGYYALRAR